MCGIAGAAGSRDAGERLGRMLGALVHRGPDDEGQAIFERVALGMRRLSIIDVAGGRQPITNEDGTVVIVANGEIYNYRKLMADLEGRGHRFKTRSDIETIAHLYEDEGLACLQRLRGMFAFALYDRKRDVVHLVRDRLGIKPLYYSEQPGGVVFASEMKALLAWDGIGREPDLGAVDAYLSLRYVPGPGTLLRGVRKLPAGHVLSWHDGAIQLSSYWQPRFTDGPYQEDEFYREAFREVFDETVRLHLESDVPFGAFLSGGLDSSAIVAAMSRVVDRPVRTFSVGFDWPGDELPQARRMAAALGCEHHEVVCRAEDIALLPKLVWHLDEPIGDAIVLPMYMLSQLARRHVKVVLSGEGADEVLAGYLFHKVLYWANRYARLAPQAVRRRLVPALVEATPTAMLNLAFAYPAALGARGRQKVADFARLVGEGSPGKQYRFLISLFDDRDKEPLYTALLRGAALQDHARNGNGSAVRADLNDLLHLQYADWLPDDILMKADKTSMANSVEGRVPFMDHVFVEFMHRVPAHLKLHGLREKVLLRDYLAGVLPPAVAGTARRAKKAFYIPLEKYFSTPVFRDLVGQSLNEASVRRRGYFQWPAVKRLVETMDGGDFLYGKQVLSLLMLELWHRMYVDREPGWL